MADIKQGRWTAEIKGDFVVFIIGARMNSRHAFRSLVDLGGRRGMNHMLKYLTEHPDKGLLGYETMGFVNVQYWRSFEHLEAFARDTNDPHLEVWRNYWKRVGTDMRTGTWHETYLVRDGEYEAIYGNVAGAWARQGEPPCAGRRIGRNPSTTQGRGGRIDLTRTPCWRVSLLERPRVGHQRLRRQMGTEPRRARHRTSAARSASGARQRRRGGPHNALLESACPGGVVVHRSLSHRFGEHGVVNSAISRDEITTTRKRLVRAVATPPR